MRCSRSLRAAIPWIACLALTTNSFPSTSAAGTQPKIVMMWQVQKGASDEVLRRLARSGVTTIQNFQMANWNSHAIGQYLDRAEKNGLNVTVYLGPLLTRDNSEWAVGRKAEEFISKWKYRKEIYAWHTFDEPKERRKAAGRQSQVTVYRAVKGLDPNRPVMVSTNVVSERDFDRYFTEAAFDILELHAYVNPKVSSRQHLMLQNFELHRTKDYPVIITLRAFDGKNWQPLPAESLIAQYSALVSGYGITKNFGLYGWHLSPNKGIADLPELQAQFDGLMQLIRVEHQ